MNIGFKIGNRQLVTDEELRKLNTLTKYPSILTYHNLGQRGSLIDSLVENKSFDDRDVYITEKIDGTNSRIVFFTNAHGFIYDYIIGSREEFLSSNGDRIINPSQGIVKNLLPIAEAIVEHSLTFPSFTLNPNSIYCLYGETYGGNINGAKQYSGHGSYGFRAFDLWDMPFDNVLSVFDMEIDKISSWREHGGQPFVDVDELHAFCHLYNVSPVPYISVIKGSSIPHSLQGVWDWMQVFASSNAKLDDDGKGMAEGIVVRYDDRSLIRKIRFEDYMRTKKMGLIK